MSKLMLPLFLFVFLYYSVSTKNTCYPVKKFKYSKEYVGAVTIDCVVLKQKKETSYSNSFLKNDSLMRVLLIKTKEREGFRDTFYVDKKNKYNPKQNAIGFGFCFNSHLWKENQSEEYYIDIFYNYYVSSYCKLIDKNLKVSLSDEEYFKLIDTYYLYGGDVCMRKIKEINSSLKK